jgi:tetratricopeptide (TPR) repeat protein
MITEVTRKVIADLKGQVRFYPSNPIAWTDLSLYYATMGQVAKAKSAMQVALGLGKANRFVLRSAARCFMHLREPDRAIDVLNRSVLCSSDPWIASAEIAISESAGLPSKCTSKARYLLPDDNLTEFSRSELAANMGTIEMKHGAAKGAKKLMRQALRDPTENALAQAEWMANQLGLGVTIAADLQRLEAVVPGSYEAQALRLYYNLEFEDSLTAAAMWGRFQQLSSRPIIHASHIAAAFLDDDARAIKILDSAMPAQAKGFLYLNNYAFSLARSGDIEAALKKLEHIDPENLSDRERSILTATRGLVYFRSGDIENGRNWYDIAIKEFDQMDDKEAAAVATYYLAREEKHIGSSNAEKRVMEAKRRLERFNLPLLSELARKLVEGSN